MQAGTKKTLIQGSTLSAGVLLAAALLGLVNYFGFKYHQRFDWTKTKIYSLSEQTLSQLGALDQDVKIYLFTSPQSPLAEPVAEILARYQAASPRMQIEEVDAERNPARAQALLEQLDSRYLQGTLKLVVETKGERRVIEEKDLAEIDYSAASMGGAPTISAFKGEQAITSAIVELTAGRKVVIRFTSGHGEKRPDDAGGSGFLQMRELIGGANFQIETWNPLGQPSVPEGTSLVVVAGPTSAFTPPELELFSRYLEDGGRMLWLLDPTLTPQGSIVDLGLDDWLARYGVRLGRDVVVDPENTLLFYGAETFYVNSWGDHPVNRALRSGDLNTLFTLARSVSREGAPEGYRQVELARTSAAGWGESDLSDPAKVAKDDADRPGPVSLGVVVEKSEPGSGADAEAATAGMRLVVIGDSDFAADSLVVQASNRLLVDSLVNWLAEREALIGIPPKAIEQSRLSLTTGQLQLVFAVVGLLPALAIAAGIWVRIRRRR